MNCAELPVLFFCGAFSGRKSLHCSFGMVRALDGGVRSVRTVIDFPSLLPQGKNTTYKEISLQEDIDNQYNIYHALLFVFCNSTVSYYQ